MTVCITARCFWNTTPMIVGATDRMITTGGIVEHEPAVAKGIPIAPRIVALVSGSLDVHTVAVETRRRLDVAGTLTVESAARIYAELIRQRRAERVLHPLGLTRETFISRQLELAPTILDHIVERLEAEDLDDLDADTIIAGVDEGAHVYTVSDNGTIVCNDHEGFAAIGIGEDLATSEFIFEGYTPGQFPEAALLTYLAKRRAESAAGVGLWTDFFVIRSAFTWIHGTSLYRELEAIWRERQEQQKELKRLGHARVAGRVEDIRGC